MDAWIQSTSSTTLQKYCPQVQKYCPQVQKGLLQLLRFTFCLVRIWHGFKIFKKLTINFSDFDSTKVMFKLSLWIITLEDLCGLLGWKERFISLIEKVKAITSHVTFWSLQWLCKGTWKGDVKTCLKALVKPLDKRKNLMIF